MNNVVAINSYLVKAEFGFAVSNKVPISIEIGDIIEIKDVQEKKVVLSVCRTIKTNDLNVNLAIVEFEVQIDTIAQETFETVETKLKNGTPIYGNVFSRISLNISENTAFSRFGPIVTMPIFYQKNGTIISRK
ncbi:hypothetical protein J6Z39_05245 [bacterium]|nr:hypothetical protein [bacterium]